MDRVLSARIDEKVAVLLDALSRKQHKSKKRILKETWGAWDRRESAAATVREARSAFRRALARRSR